MALRRDQPSKGLGHVVGREAGRPQEGAALHQLDHGAPGRPHGAAAVGVEAGLDHDLALHADGHADEVAASGTTGRPGMRPVGQRAQASRRAQVVLERHCESA